MKSTKQIMLYTLLLIGSTGASGGADELHSNLHEDLCKGGFVPYGAQVDLASTPPAAAGGGGHHLELSDAEENLTFLGHAPTNPNKCLRYSRCGVKDTRKPNQRSSPAAVNGGHEEELLDEIATNPAEYAGADGAGHCPDRSYASGVDWKAEMFDEYEDDKVVCQSKVDDCMQYLQTQTEELEPENNKLMLAEKALDTYSKSKEADAQKLEDYKSNVNDQNKIIENKVREVKKSQKQLQDCEDKLKWFDFNKPGKIVKYRDAAHPMVSTIVVSCMIAIIVFFWLIYYLYEKAFGKKEDEMKVTDGEHLTELIKKVTLKTKDINDADDLPTK